MPKVDMTTQIADKATPAGSDDLLGINRADNTVATFQIDTLPISTPVQDALDAKADDADVTAIDGRVAALEGAPPAHAHPIADVTGLQAALDTEATARGTADAALSGRLDTLEALDLVVQGDLDAHADDTTGVHGIADTTALVVTTDPRLSDARTPTAHGHAVGDVTGLQAALDGKEDDLGSPASDGQILSSTAAGVRSWIDPPAGGGGDAVESVNGQTGAVVLAAADVGADAAGTATGAVTAHNSNTSAHGQTAAGRALLTAADAAAQRGALGLGDSATQDAADLALDASQITTGTIAAARLGSGATGGGTKFLADDQTYKTVEGGGGTTSNATGLLYAGWLM